MCHQTSGGESHPLQKSNPRLLHPLLFVCNSDSSCLLHVLLIPPVFMHLLFFFPLLSFACTPRDSSPRRFWGAPTLIYIPFLNHHFRFQRHSPPPKRKMDESQRTQVADATFREMVQMLHAKIIFLWWEGLTEICFTCFPFMVSPPVSKPYPSSLLIAACSWMLRAVSPDMSTSIWSNFIGAQRFASWLCWIKLNI